MASAFFQPVFSRPSPHLHPQQPSYLKELRTMTSTSSPVSIYNSSTTPSHLPWNTYNYCNAPHVSSRHYQVPEQAQGGKAELVYLNVIQRHHKRTPDNLYPRENELNSQEWDCSDYRQVNYGVDLGSSGPSNQIYHKTNTPSWHPLVPLFWNGTCDQGQLTSGGLRDAVQKGKDFFSVYGPNGPSPLLRRGIHENDVLFRTSNSDRTYSVAGGILKGMGHVGGSFPVHTQPSSIDSLVPNYSCSYANRIREAFQDVAEWKDHLASKAQLFDSLNQVVGTGSRSDWNSWIDHHFDALASRQCSGHDLPTNPMTGSRVTQEMADQVYLEGDWEYDYIWNRAEGADEYVKYGFGVFLQELANNLKAFRDQVETFKLKYYVGHDGTMVRLLKSLAQSGSIRWPALGSEVILEVWRSVDDKSKGGKKLDHHVRILSYGQTLRSEAKLLTNAKGLADWVPLDDVIRHLEGRVPQDLLEKCTSS
ncbi:phosphoglycerate mutase-like protein [Violaceomyces palustris]|uniref:Phosphoglycerate mutase-like protein n=1 Tax=Violaceomyces palustris TaxID=1673888 RepID=A0ACD0NS94_9BASI|nr:phosphoglycerate mutase-like protein [Violaceomyces palustris]